MHKLDRHIEIVKGISILLVVWVHIHTWGMHFLTLF